MTIDEAIRDLLSISTDVRRVVVVDAGGAVLGAGPGGAGADVAAALDGLWAAASSSTAGGAEVEHVVVRLDDGAVAAVAAGGRRIVALTAPDPPLGLVLFDLRTCLADAFPSEVPGSVDEGGADPRPGSRGEARAS